MTLDLAFALKILFLGISHSKEKGFWTVLFRDNVICVLADISALTINPKIQQFAKVEKIRLRTVKIPKPKLWLAA